MSTSDGNSTTRPLRRRQSKRFDRSGGSPIVTGSTIIDTDEDDVQVDVPETDNDLPDSEGVGATTATDHDPTPQPESDIAEELADAAEPAEPETVEEPPPVSADGVENPRAEPAGRTRTLDQMSPCGRCGHDVSIVHIEVDGNILMMESCDNCDTRRWQLAGESIELQQALDHVGEHTGRRR